MKWRNFFICGLAGWCMEIVFTSFGTFLHGDPRLLGQTSLWMFPIYGMACFLTPICRILKGKNIFFRGSVYTCCIFAGEYLTGSLLKRHNACPWDYSSSPCNVRGLIRLDYAPYWFGAGLIFEKLLTIPWKTGKKESSLSLKKAL